MCNGARERSIRRCFPGTIRLGGALALAIGVALLAGSDPAAAAPDAAIQRVRVASQPGYDRIVFDLSAAGVAASASSDPEELRLEATAPPLEGSLRAELDSLGLRIVESLAGTRVQLNVAAGTWTAFRLRANSPGAGDRIVLDLGRGVAPPPIPPDADPLSSAPPPVVLGQAPPAVAAPPPAVTLPVATPPAVAPRSGTGGQSVPAAAPPSAASPEEAARRGSGPPSPLWIRPQGIEFAGLSPAGPAREALLDLELQVRSAAGGDWEDGSGDPTAVRRRLRDLVRGGSFAPRLEGAVLQQLTARIASAYAARGMYGTRVEIRRSALEPLMANRPGPLIVHVEERLARP